MNSRIIREQEASVKASAAQKQAVDFLENKMGITESYDEMETCYRVYNGEELHIEQETKLKEKSFSGQRGEKVTIEPIRPIERKRAVRVACCSL